ncbi:hypothetical protein BGZ61DRAFT_372921 [Ilyonectria robusta]|uniref:uncharacterized protein n=1 Tax=Ilyonectria robusta TaxID=1079257 RepID=UPI001E8E4ADC|nr:uncharacterized protein BGZ61DRAFT_372921 [Ilyonectria robusta]KAH8654899.1 hypothetical protein BGZ61DRAFT_372921 [Ilyonectria robusta]
MFGIFCCPDIKPYRPELLDHAPKFTAFLNWARHRTSCLVLDDGFSLVSSAPYAVQFVRQVNNGLQEVIRYFVPTTNGLKYMEATENDLLRANFEKLNAYMNFKCEVHNKFYEVNLYQKNPTNAHHRLVNLAQPSKEIDLAFRQRGAETESFKGDEVKERENRWGPLSSVVQRKNFLKTLQESSKSAMAEERKRRPSHAGKQLAAQPNTAALKTVLQFLLPTVRISRSNPLLSLLSLDWINEKLGLGLEFEDLWWAELTSSNIIILITECFEMADSDSVDLAEVEDLVVRAMHNTDTFANQKRPGRVRLQEIIGKVLECGRTVRWQYKFRDNITCVLQAGPSKELLEQCRRRDEALQQDTSDQNIYGTNKFYAEGVTTTPTSDYSYSHHHFDYNYVSEPMKDLTDCDNECRFWGNCDY